MPPQGNLFDIQEEILEYEFPNAPKIQELKSRAKGSAPPVMLSALDHIGNTPLIRLNKIPQSVGIKCDVYAKCEFYGPGGSHKDRMALQMVEDAERDGKLKPGSTIIEPTSGNTGIGIALVAAVKGYKSIFVVPEKNSQEKLNTMIALGAKIVKTPGVPFDSPDSFISVANRLQKEIPDSIILNQFANPANPAAHYDNTSLEILEQCGGKLDMLVVGVGSGGAITGLGKRMNEACKSCTVVGVDPIGSFMAQPEEMNGVRSKWEIEGIGQDDFVPVVLDRSVVHKWIKTNDKDSFVMSRRLIQEEGLLVGGSCGSVLSGALQAIKDANLKEGQKCVVFFPDSIRNYMTKFLSDQWLLEKNLLEESALINSNDYTWWNKKVGDLNLGAPLTVTPEMGVQETLSIMKKNGLAQIPVVGVHDGSILGVLTLTALLAKLLEKNVTGEERIDSVLSRQFKKINVDTSLGKAVHILQDGNTGLVIRTTTSGDTMKEVLVGAVTQMDLLNFIMTNPSSQKSMPFSKCFFSLS